MSGTHYNTTDRHNCRPHNSYKVKTQYIKIKGMVKSALISLEAGVQCALAHKIHTMHTICAFMHGNNLIPLSAVYYRVA